MKFTLVGLVLNAVFLLPLNVLAGDTAAADQEQPRSYNPFAMSEIDKRLERSRREYFETLARIEARKQREDDEQAQAFVATPVASHSEGGRATPVAVTPEPTAEAVRQQRKLMACLDDRSVEVCLEEVGEK